MILSVHQREFPFPVEEVRGWLDRTWTGTADDRFPVDWVPTHRQNPPGTPAHALIPQVTLLAHGFLPFRFDRQDSLSWWVKTPFQGRHGFQITPTTTGCRLEHRLELDGPRWTDWAWTVIVRDGHDWAVEAIFDRIGQSLRGDALRSPRPPWKVRFALFLAIRCLPQGWQCRVRESLEQKI